MRNKELFNACTKECVWCKLQWPLTLNSRTYEHVGPYTKDRKLFSWNCKANTIRTAFNYAAYAGGKKLLRKLPIVKGNKLRMGPCTLTINSTSPSNRRFWRTAMNATLSVAEWPDWKLSSEYNEKTGQWERGKHTPPEQLAQIRQDLEHYDALDFIARQTCTENLQYRAKIVGGRVPQPSCNGGVGCTTCWMRHDTYRDKQSEGCDI